MLLLFDAATVLDDTVDEEAVVSLEDVTDEATVVDEEPAPVVDDGSLTTTE